jgi:hypothetical protein
MPKTLLVYMVGFGLVLSSSMAEAHAGKPVQTAKQAEEIAARNSTAHTPDSDPKNWTATFDAKSKTWMACAGRPVSSPQSGYCTTVDAKTGQVVHSVIIN